MEIRGDVRVPHLLHQGAEQSKHRRVKGGQVGHPARYPPPARYIP